MNCNDILPLICGYLDGANTESENKNLQAHLTTCAHCRELMAEMQGNDRLLSDVPEPPADLTWCIMQQVRKEPKKRRNWKPWGAALSAAAVLTVVLLSGVFSPGMTKETAVRTDAAPITDNEVVWRIATEAYIPAEAVTEACSTDEMAMERYAAFAAYLYTAPIAELEALEPMDLNEARTLLTADAAALLDVMATGELQAYLISEAMMQELQTNYVFELLSGNSEAENYLVFISTADANTP